MQNRYAGDVGDFGKIGMLRNIEQYGIKVGINWYLVEDENHNLDGKHIRYLEKEAFSGIDDELREALWSLIKNHSRSVDSIEKLNLLQSGIYFHEILQSDKEVFSGYRNNWHQKGLDYMRGCELVFLDPDNGLLPKSVGRGSVKSKKYVFPEEILGYYEAGHSVVFYSHRTREQLGIYLKRFSALFDSEKLKNATIIGVSFRRGTVRDYFYILHEEHKERILKSIESLLNNNWNQHFMLIEMPQNKLSENVLY